MSFDQVEYQFDQKCYVVRAENKDNEGQQSNGGGKTSFVDIIAIGLLGYSLTGRNVKDCVNWNSDQKHFTIKVYLENLEHKANLYIERKIYSGTKGQELTILVNDEVPSTLPTKRGVADAIDVKAGNTYILNELLDITEQDLLSYYLISKQHYQPFLYINTDRKLEVIGRFSNANVVDQAIENLHTNDHLIEDHIHDYNTHIAKVQGAIEVLQQSLTNDAAKQFEIDKHKKIEQKQARIEFLFSQVENLNNRIEEIDRKIESFVDEQIDSEFKILLQQELSASNSYVQGVTQSIRDTKKQIGTIESYLAGLIECPNCKKKFHSSTQHTYTEVDLIEWQESLANLEAMLVETNDKIQEYESSLDLIRQIERTNHFNWCERTRLTEQKQAIEQQAQETLQDAESALGELQQIEVSTFADQQQSVVQAIATKQQELADSQQEIQALQQMVDNNNKWTEQLEDFKFYLGNKPIQTICSLVNQYLKLNGSDLNLYIEGFKKLRSGEIRQALTPVIYRNWLNPQSINQFSEGEKVRVNLAVDLAFQQLINSASKMGGLDLYVSDEIINPLDSLGVANAARAFNNLDKTILLVSHSGADLVYDNTIVIEKSKQVSKIL